MAVEAGADILFMPANPERAIQAICDAVASGRISRERIRASVERIWQAKQKVSIESGFKTEASDSTFNIQQFVHELAQPTARDTVTKILRDSQQVGGTLPLSLDPSNNRTRQLRNLIVVDELIGCDFLGRTAPAVTIPRQLDYELQLVDRNSPKTLEKDDDPVVTCLTLLQLFIRGNPFRGSAGLSPVAAEWLKNLLKNNNLQALVIYGSPYVLEQFLADLPPATPYVFSYGQMPQAQAIALDVLFREQLPVKTFTQFI
jgi:beta-glucosidase